MEFEELITAMALKVKNQREVMQTEEATKNAFVMPFISNILGYDVFNPLEVVPDFTADVGIKKVKKSTTPSCAMVKFKCLSSARSRQNRSKSKTPPSSIIFRGHERTNRGSD